MYVDLGSVGSVANGHIVTLLAFTLSELAAASHVVVGIVRDRISQTSPLVLPFALFSCGLSGVQMRRKPISGDVGKRGATIFVVF